MAKILILGDTTSWISCVPTHSQYAKNSRPRALITRAISQGCYLQLPNLRKWSNIYLCIQELVCLLLIQKRVHQIRCSLAVTQTYCVHSIHLGSSGPPTMGHGSKGKNDTHMLMLMLLPVQQIIKSCVSDAGAPRLLPASTKQRDWIIISL